MNFTKIYNQIINNLLLEGNLKQLSNLFQNNYLNGKSYNQLSNDQKLELNNYIKDQKKSYLDYVSDITDNPQFQSTIYDWLINRSIVFPEDIDKVKEIINDYIQLMKQSEIKFKNISEFETYSDLFKYIQSFKKQSKLNTKLPFELIYQNNSYNLYQINEDQYQQFNQYYGGNEFYNTGWCVAKNQSYFNDYLKTDNDQYILWTNKDDSPFALLHFDSNQFKDTSDKSLQDNSIEVLDGLNFLLDKYNIDYKNLKGDFTFYRKDIWLYKNPNGTDFDWLLFYYNLTYNKDTDRYDCNQNIIGYEDLVLDGKFIIKFGTVNGGFDCSSLNLITLENGPTKVNGSFYCYNNQLTSLQYCPTGIVKGNFICSNNKLTSLQYCPTEISHSFNCSYNQLTSLQYCPLEVGGDFCCQHNQIDTLKYHPDIVKRTFCIQDNKLTKIETKPNWIKGRLLI